MSTNEAYPRHWRCKGCGQSSPVENYRCVRCGADLALLGEVVFDEAAPPAPPPPPPVDWEVIEEEKSVRKAKGKRKDDPKQQKPAKTDSKKKGRSALWLIPVAMVLALLIGLLPGMLSSRQNVEISNPEIPSAEEPAPVETEPPQTEEPVVTDPEQTTEAPETTEPPTTQPATTKPVETTQPITMPTEPALCEKISLNQSQIECDAIGGIYQIIYQLYPADTQEEVMFSSGDETVATVDAQGLIVIKGEGSTTITVSCGSVSAQCEVICALPTEATDVITLNRKDITFTEAGLSWLLYDGAIDVAEIVWTSDNNKVATIENGKVTAVANGTTTVYGYYKGQTVSCTIRCRF